MTPLSDIAATLRQRIRESVDMPTAHHACESCLDTGFVRKGDSVAVCRCRRRKIIAEKLEAIPRRFREARLGTYRPRDEAQALAIRTVTQDPFGSYYLYGAFRRGKTHLAIAQYAAVCSMDKPCLWMSMAELIQDLRRAEIEEDYFCLVRHRVRYAESFHLFIDDIDKHKPTEFKFETLFDVIDTIYKRELGLTVTSNCSLERLADSGIVHGSIVRRIEDICKAVKV